MSFIENNGFMSFIETMFQEYFTEGISHPVI